MIYAIAPDVGVAEVKVIKFGRSKSPQERLAALQSGNPVLLRLYAAVDWPDVYEGLIHQKFSSKRRLGEWFEVDDEINEFMNAMVYEPDKAKASLGDPKTVGRVEYVVSGESPLPPHNRWARNKYNSYMREYMKRRRAAKVRSEPGAT